MVEPYRQNCKVLYTHEGDVEHGTKLKLAAVVRFNPLMTGVKLWHRLLQQMNKETVILTGRETCEGHGFKRLGTNKRGETCLKAKRTKSTAAQEMHSGEKIM